LKRGGAIVIEFGREQSGAVESLLEESGAFTDVRVVRDFQNIPRIASARRT
jgi:methylase of polypeptide subunit release factors